ncbi:MerC mercury resistance protein [Mucilaginibacter oryzae]|uniref:MerC mercury resistance protein n=1 Tax=Mucilaginibacter oryzae TaxID=468058 RepID=A0A316HD96_9SPHI|nr:MerC domain-containing protein [Mucilaginibacter oryzae]PWK78498.1 MerC mercury resistance protein [Mucilaginibacter oryzae]
MNFQKLSPLLDNIGLTASTLCAVHCAVVPLVLTGLPLIGLGFLANAWVEWAMIIFALAIGAYSIGLSYTRTHHRSLPLLMLATGFGLILAGHVFSAFVNEALVVPAGGLLIAAAHYVNYRFTGTCNHDHKVYKLKKVE